MTYEQILDALKVHGERYPDFKFITVGQQQANTYTTITEEPSQALIILDPPRYTGSIDTMLFSKKYEITMAFMIDVDQDATYEQAQARVNVADTHATHFLHSINQNFQVVAEFDTATISNVRVTPWHRFTWNVQHMAGVSLEFNIETLDTFDYCDLESLAREFARAFAFDFK